MDDSTVRRSEYVRNLLNDFNSEVEIIIPEKYYGVIDNYIDYLRGNRSLNKESVSTDLVRYFEMSSYFGDDDYLFYLMEWALTYWSVFYLQLDKVPMAMKEDIYHHTPYEFLPEDIMDKPSFFKSWLKVNQNTKIMLNANEVYHTEVKYNEQGQMLLFSVYHTINHREVGYKRLKAWYSNGQPEYEAHYYNGKKHGVFRQWSEDSLLVYEHNFDNERAEGLWLENFRNDRNKVRGFYHKGKRVGLWQHWDKQGRKYQDTQYDN